MKREPTVPTLALHVLDQYLRHLRAQQDRLRAEREPYVSGRRTVRDGQGRDITAEVIAQMTAEIDSLERTAQSLIAENEPWVTSLRAGNASLP